MTRHRKTPADIRREALAQAGLRAPNALPSAVEGMREFGLNDEYAKTLCHPPSALPSFPKCDRPPVVWSGDNPFPIPPGLRTPGQRGAGAPSPSPLSGRGRDPRRRRGRVRGL